MTHKEAFDAVKTHLLTQNVQAYNPDNSVCQYRTPKGLKCAIGCLIPDSEYGPHFESMSLSGVQLACPSLRGLDYDFLSDLQRLHDGNTPRTWPMMLDDFEDQYSELIETNERPQY